jgi:pSer/pThr/pTyr-binding forkhead associated (FHA) protein
LVGGKGRGRSDGCVLVGSQEFVGGSEEVYNDVVLEGEEIGRRHFLIKYNQETTRYYLRDLGDGNGTFVRLDDPLQLKTGYIISFGDNHMFIQIYEDHQAKVSKLEIKFLDGPKTDESYLFGKPLL